MTGRATGFVDTRVTKFAEQYVSKGFSTLETYMRHRREIEYVHKTAEYVRKKMRAANDEEIHNFVAERSYIKANDAADRFAAQYPKVLQDVKDAIASYAEVFWAGRVLPRLVEYEANGLLYGSEHYIVEPEVFDVPRYWIHFVDEFKNFPLPKIVGGIGHYMIRPLRRNNAVYGLSVSRFLRDELETGFSLDGVGRYVKVRYVDILMPPASTISGLKLDNALVKRADTHCINGFHIPHEEADMLVAHCPESVWIREIQERFGMEPAPFQGMIVDEDGNILKKVFKGEFYWEAPPPPEEKKFVLPSARGAFLGIPTQERPRNPSPNPAPAALFEDDEDESGNT